MEILKLHKIISNRNDCIQLVDGLEEREVFLGSPVKGDGCNLINGHFKSPICDVLPNLVPQKCKTAYFQIVLPKTLSDSTKGVSPSGHMCVHMAGTGDHGFSRRRELIAKPLLSHGISSLILENPYYGQRKPTEQSRSGLLQVKDLFIMGLSLVLEGQYLLRWLEKEGYGPLGLTGISMGGHMASLAATSWPKPLAIIPCMSWTSASVVWTEGVLSKAIQWRTLEAQYADCFYSIEPLMKTQDCGSKKIEVGQPSSDFENKEKALRRRQAVVFMKNVMDQVTGLRNFSVPIDPTMATFVVAKADAYYPIGKLKPMDEIWPGCNVRYLNTGHILGYLMHHRNFCKAIVDTFGRFDEKYLKPESDKATGSSSSFPIQSSNNNPESFYMKIPLSDGAQSLIKTLKTYTIKS